MVNMLDRVFRIVPRTSGKITDRVVTQGGRLVRVLGLKRGEHGFESLPSHLLCKKLEQVLRTQLLGGTGVLLSHDRNCIFELWQEGISNEILT